MPFIHNRGDQAARIWIVVEKPYPTDIPKGFLFSGGLGNVYEKMLQEAGLSLNDCYVCSRIPNTDDSHAFSNIIGSLNQAMPPLVLVLNEAGYTFIEELKYKGENSKGQLQKYVGSLLQCKHLTYPHYMIPLYGPDRCIADWTERNITTYVDMQKIRDEFIYWKANKILRPLLERELKYGDFEIGELLTCLDGLRGAPILSVDIETVYPRQKSAFLPHPGYPITLGIASSNNYGISFNLFREDPRENRILWRTLDSLFQGAAILGQNFFNFDALFLEAIGFSISLDKVKDTLIRHHILWPELSHKLQFMTRQYTREPYYKDEGHGWSVKHMDKLRRYNCLDVCVTYEIYEAQEKEFKQRQHLR
jgi:hypothetical protein